TLRAGSIAGTTHRVGITPHGGSTGDITLHGVTMPHAAFIAGITLRAVSTPRAGLTGGTTPHDASMPRGASKDLGAPSLHAGSISHAKSAASIRPHGVVSA